MQIYSGTGVTNFTSAPITKSPDSLIITMPKAVSALSNELITIWVERQSGQNIYLATKVKLRHFIMACLSAQLSQSQLHGSNTVVAIDMGLEAALKLATSEKMYVRIEGVQTSETWSLNVTEGREVSTQHINFDYKSMLTGEQEKSFNVSNHEIAVFEVPEELNEIGLVRGTVEQRFTPFELSVLQKEDFPVLGYTATGVIPADSAILVLPLQGIDAINFYKDTDGIIGMTLMNYGQLVSPSKAATLKVR